MGKYIHYGHSCFDISKFDRIHEREDGYFIKPVGGLWASYYVKDKRPLDDISGEWNIDWREWCLIENFHTERLNESFTFDLKPDAKIFEVRNMSDIQTLKKLGAYFEDKLFYYTKLTVLESLGYDGIQVWMSPDIYDALYGWDCDSILIFNPDIILPEA